MKTILAAFLLLFTGFAGSDPWAPEDVMQPKELADRLNAKDQAKPPVFYLGFPALFKGGAHIAGATLAGPCSKPEGLDALKKAVSGWPHNKEIVLYCGCCPLVKCPNIRPAYSALHDMGFSNIKIVTIETNLHTDWVEKGYPTEKSAQ